MQETGCTKRKKKLFSLAFSAPLGELKTAFGRLSRIVVVEGSVASKA
jgi:hypothetical protein